MLDGLAAFIGANFSASEALSAPEAEEEEERASQRGKKGGEFAKLSKSLSEEQLKAELSMEDAAAVEVVQVTGRVCHSHHYHSRRTHHLHPTAPPPPLPPAVGTAAAGVPALAVGKGVCDGGGARRERRA